MDGRLSLSEKPAVSWVQQVTLLAERAEAEDLTEGLW